VKAATPLELRREARRCFRRWASDVAKGGPRPPNGLVLRAGAAIAAREPAQLLEALAEAAKQDPEILVVDGDAARD
jgi:hypothetical protein